MTNRQWLGDLSLAVLVALPLLSLASPELTNHRSTAASGSIQMASADRAPTAGRIGLLS
jgi:hypothetical protein